MSSDDLIDEVRERAWWAAKWLFYLGGLGYLIYALDTMRVAWGG